MTPLQHLSKQPKTSADKAADKAHVLDEATQALIQSIEAKDRRFRRWFILSWTVLLVIGIAGIYRQNDIASQNQKHIDCIVKLFTTPLPASAHSRQIANPSTSCNIKFN